MKKPTSTNVAHRSFYDSIATLERRHASAAITTIHDTLARVRNDLVANIPAIVQRAAPSLESSLARRLASALASVVAADLDRHLENLRGAGDSFAASLAAEEHAKAADTLAKSGARAIVELVVDITRQIATLPPPQTGQGSSRHNVPLIAFARNGKAVLTNIVRAVIARQAVLPTLADAIADNLARAHGYDRDDPRSLPPPSSLEGSAQNAAVITFADTPLLDVLLTPIPLSISLETRYQHQWLVGGTGSGKTQTLQDLIAEHLSLASPPSLVVIDSQGDMLSKIARLDLFAPGKGRLADKLIIVQPRDVDYPPALNLFAVNRRRLAAMSAADREQFTNGLVELYETIFSQLLDAGMTQKQSVLFRFLARLMISIPGATIHTLRAFLEDPAPFQPYVFRLEGTAHEFLTRQFAAKDFAQTREQVLRRLYGILEQPTFERMFSTPTMRIDLYDALQTGHIVLVDTAQDFLKPERSAILGRLFVALTLQAAMERAAIPRDRRHPTFLILDEAHEYLDASTMRILTQARKMNFGLVAAHQELAQLPPGLQSALATNTAIKMAARVSNADASSLAREMRTTPDDILNLDVTCRGATFSTFVLGLTPSAIPINTPFGRLEAMPRMSDAAYRALLADNRRRYCEPTATAPSHRAIAPRHGAANPAPTSPAGQGSALPLRPPAPTPASKSTPKPAPKSNGPWWS